MDDVKFISLIEKYYDGLDLKFRKQIPLHRMLVPDVLPAAGPFPMVPAGTGKTTKGRRNAGL